MPLYFLDADVEENPDEIREVTDRLYGGDTEHRLRQEILLGIGGVRALQAVGVEAQVFHTNEGHAGFLGLERIRQLVVDQGLSYPEAIEAVRAGLHLHHPHPRAGRHRPVPARADGQLLRRAGATRSGVRLDDLLALGHRPGDEADEPFNMAVMGLRLAGRSNGVAKLHGEVSREMFGDLWPDLEPDEAPDRVDHQRRPRPHLDVARDHRRAVPLRAPRVGRGRAPTSGPASSRRPTTSCGAPASRPASGWSPSSAAA